MKTRIFIETEFGTAEFVGASPESADRALKGKLRKIKLSIKKLKFYYETECNGELHISYGYLPTASRYDRRKAESLIE